MNVKQEEQTDSTQNIAATFATKIAGLTIDHGGKRILNVGNRINLFDMYLKLRAGKQVREDMSLRDIPEEIDHAVADAYLNM